jgi:hypothetical protein
VVLLREVWSEASIFIGSRSATSLEVGIFGPLKRAERERVEQLYGGGAGIVGKQHLQSAMAFFSNQAA